MSSSDSIRRLGLVPILLFTLATNVSAGFAAYQWDDLPAVRVSYAELFKALRKVRESFHSNSLRQSDYRPSERLTFGLDLAPDQLAFPSLESAEAERLPTVSRDVRYAISDYGAKGVTSATVELRSWLTPIVSASGTDEMRMQAVLTSAKGAFAPHENPITSHQRRTQYGLVGFWIVVQIFVSVRARRSKSSGKASHWAQLYVLTPIVGLMVFTLGGSRLLPGLVAYGLGASWWDRQQSNVLLAIVAVGFTGVILLGGRLSARAQKRQTAARLDPTGGSIVEAPPGA